MALSTTGTLSLSNLQRPEIRANPYPFYEQLRNQDPVHWDEEMGFWVLTRYDDISAVYTHPHFSRAQGLMRGYDLLPADEQAVAQPVYHSFSKTVLYADPPYHTRLRSLMNSAFTPRAVEQMRPYIQKVVDELLDAHQAAGQMDLMRALAHPLPIMVICEMLGLPAEERQRFKEWSDDLFAILGTVRRGTGLMGQAAHSLTDLTEYVTRLSRERRLEPRLDLLSALLGAVEEGEHLSEEELVANVSILMSAGHETTSNMIGNGVLALLQHPEQAQALRADPQLAASAVEEILRYDSPVQISYRSAAADLQIGEKQIAQGELVNSILGSANRDPERFSKPAHFDITRNEGRHLALGLGIHFCLGAPLLRLEGEIAFSTILERFPRLQLATEKLEWQEHPIFRGVKALPVSF